MRLGIISDIHGNAVALQEVLIALEDAGVDEIICLGDVVGYGPHPGLCSEIVRGSCSLVIAGNHDRALGDIEVQGWFNPVADSALEWTRERLDDEDLEWLLALPSEAPHAEGPLCCHGAPGAPDDYVLTARDARDALLASACGIILCGHTHRPMACDINGRRQCTWLHWCDGDVVPLEKGHRYLFNPGSVGQPRDNDSRAAYMVIDLARQEASLHRSRYEVGATQRAMRSAGLPEELAKRLATGV